MNLHALKLFHTAAQEGSVTRAAELLHISQPAVTVQIRNLEKEIGMPLLLPKGRGIMLTEAGQFVADQAGRLFALESEIEREIIDFKSGLTGKLRIAATYLPANFLLPRWIAVYKRGREGVQVLLQTANAQDAMFRLAHYEADLAIIGGGIEPAPGIVRSLLFEDQMWFVAPKGHALANKRETTLAEVLREPFIMREEGSRTREMLLALCRTARLAPPRAAVEWNGMNEAVRAVKAGVGLLFASASEVREDVDRGDVSFVNVSGIHAVNPIAIYYREGETLSQQAQAFIEIAKKGS
ncbi:LysR family transcriptional regulator [Paenibacillus harenae]|uniref:LysR family transcriptional regulator n=1 Tax=Paenibacillus harenae TaxID=306543 RepID=UPI002791E34D|nr:LysR family transcriptional regulator [Paenibacillus harenae]MDQ0057944.1 DNA-binding transcriptional LysR family regulator [Paenibacillus harenae]